MAKKLVNWQGGMDVSGKHFTQTEDYFIEAIRDCSSINLTGYNYGLLPSQGRDNSDGISIHELMSGHIEIELMYCNAITSSGVRIAFNPDQQHPLVKSYTPAKEEDKKGEQVKQWDIILSVDPFKRIPTGELSPDEDPPRHPDVESAYSLFITKMGEINTAEFGAHHLTIGRIRRTGDRYEVDSNYIPPCTTMSSYADLSQYFNRFGEQLAGLERSSKAIIEKVHSRAGRSELGTNIKNICEDILRYIAPIYFDFRNRVKFESPIKTVNHFASLAHVCSVSLNFIDNTQKEELLKYFYEWSDVAPGSFEELLASTLEIRYDHNNLRAMMFQVDAFMSIMTELWTKLSRLEYIGQHKDNIIISERKQQAEITPKSGWSTID